jgi:hypothetical protein
MQISYKEGTQKFMPFLTKHMITIFKDVALNFLTVEPILVVVIIIRKEP